MMKFLGLLIGLQAFAVVPDSFWKHNRSNLQNDKQYSAEKLYLIGRRRGSDRTMETDRTFGSNQCEPPRFGSVRTMESQSLWPQLFHNTSGTNKSKNNPFSAEG